MLCLTVMGPLFNITCPTIELSIPIWSFLLSRNELLLCSWWKKKLGPKIAKLITMSLIFLIYVNQKFIIYILLFCYQWNIFSSEHFVACNNLLQIKCISFNWNNSHVILIIVNQSVWEEDLFFSSRYCNQMGKAFWIWDWRALFVGVSSLF